MIPSILLIKKDSQSLVDRLQELLGNSVRIRASTTGMDGLDAYQQYHPLIVIVDEDLPDFNGLSIATILKDVENEPCCLVYLLIHNALLEHTRADRYIAANIPMDIFLAQIRTDFKLLMRQETSESYQNAIRMQNDMLPRAIETPAFRVGSIFSAYNRLSGDSINYWVNNNNLYGYLADCEGHDLASYGQVGSTWLSLKKAMWSYQVGIHSQLSDVMSVVNQDYVTLYDRTTIVPSIAFCLDCQAGILKYCPAGIPELFIRQRGKQYEPIDLQSPLLGYEMESQFREYNLPLQNVDSIVFSSDGLSDLLRSEWQETALPMSKHDDVSAIYIRFPNDDHDGHRRTQS